MNEVLVDLLIRVQTVLFCIIKMIQNMLIQDKTFDVDKVDLQNIWLAVYKDVGSRKSYFDASIGPRCVMRRDVKYVAAWNMEQLIVELYVKNERT